MDKILVLLMVMLLFSGCREESGSQVSFSPAFSDLGTGYSTSLSGGGSNSYHLNPEAAAPEPATLALFSIGLGGLAVTTLKRKRRVKD